tara:strand:- start:348 stop:587 length:240 start_codon:yes stop_codon:yes gene_type:complete
MIMYLSFQDRSIELENGKKEIISALESSPYLSMATILLLVLLTLISVLRALESRKQWRKIALEDKINEKLDELERKKDK